VPPSAPASARRIARRVLGSALAQALTTPHGVDRYVELVAPAFSLSDVRAEVVAVRHATARSVTLTLRPNENWRGFRAGQFVNLSAEVDGVRRTRCYSPASSAHEPDLLELTVHAVPDGTLSPHLKATARPGTVVELSQAGGDFHLSDARPRALLLISGGSGITATMSMLRTLCDEGYDGPIAFVHYARGGQDLAYATALPALARRHANVRLLRAWTGADAVAGELRGRFGPAHVEAAAAAAGLDLAATETFVCGPPGLVDAVSEHWLRDGLEARLHVERFAPPAAMVVAPADAAAATGSVRFARSGRAVPNTGAPLLEQAEAAGLTPRSGCRMGICHTCTCRKVAGAVRDVRSGEISADPDERIQICVSVPVGDVTLDI
jgi:ferredoxin-NADP reductase